MMQGQYTNQSIIEHKENIKQGQKVHANLMKVKFFDKSCRFINTVTHLWLF
jgi:hypothetical protein